MDIGTNTELLVGNRHRLLAASCPAGPAFEGGAIACGMPGLEGAIEDGIPVKCKRRGLKIVLSVSTRKGEGLMRRLDVSLDPIVMLDAALQEAAKAAGVELTVENGAILITPSP